MHTRPFGKPAFSDAAVDDTPVAMHPLEHLLFPLTPAMFFEDVWERRHHLLHRQAPGHYADLFSVDDVDAVIGLSDLLGPQRQDIRLIRQTADRFEVRPGRDHAITSLSDIYDAYAGGFTIVVNNLERRWAPLAELTLGLERAFQCRVTINVYATPRGAQGFARHFDTHDVFVMQIAGEKTWVVSPPETRLPLASAPGHTGSPFAVGKPAAAEECVVTPGDLLYLPRGVVHEARTGSGSSVHLTVGVHVTRWADLMSSAIRVAAERHERLREAVPPGWLRGDGPADAVGARLRESLHDIGASLSEAEVVAARRRQFLAERRHGVDGHFRSLDRLHDLAPSSRIRRRPGLECHVVSQDDATVLYAGGDRRIDAPARVAPQLSFIAAHEAFTIDELPGPLDDNGKVTLVRRLVREGILSVDPVESE
jgi:ribosomal protein L16 Arg81 hydroxylase